MGSGPRRGQHKPSRKGLDLRSSGQPPTDSPAIWANSLPKTDHEPSAWAFGLQAKPPAPRQTKPHTGQADKAWAFGLRANNPQTAQQHPPSRQHFCWGGPTALLTTSQEQSAWALGLQAKQLAPRFQPQIQLGLGKLYAAAPPG